MSQLPIVRSLSAATLPKLPAIRVARKGTAALGIKLAGAGVALVLQISLARVLGQAGYGEYVYVFAWLQLTLMFAQGGFSTSALRYVAKYRALGQLAFVRGFLRRSSQITSLQSLVLALLLAGGAVVFTRSGSTESIPNFWIAAAAVPILSLFLLGSAIVRGLGHVIPSMLVSLIQPLLLLAALLPITHFLRTPISSRDALWLYLGAALAALAVVVLVQRHFQRTLDWGSPCSFLTGQWVGTATLMMLASTLMYLQGRTGVIISGLFLDRCAVGTYAAMERLADAALLGLASVNMLAAPSFAALHTLGRRSELQRYARIAAWGSTIFMLALVVPLVLFGKPILRLFGDEFVSGYPVLLVLLGGVAVNAMCGSVGLLLNMTGHQRSLLTILAAGLGVNLVLSALLVPRFGIIGTATANTMAILFWNLCMVGAVRVHLGMWPNFGRIASTKIV